VTKSEFKNFTDSVNGLVDVIKDLKDKIDNQTPDSKPVAPETPAEKEIRKAAPDETTVPPEWREKAEEIVGEALERCELRYVKSGGALFSLIIKKEFSNAPKDYMAYYHEDRRTKEIGHDGIEGVEQWCKLVHSNLTRTK
jgi:hypothetical protein